MSCVYFSDGPTFSNTITWGNISPYLIYLISLCIAREQQKKTIENVQTGTCPSDRRSTLPLWVLARWFFVTSVSLFSYKYLIAQNSTILFQAAVLIMHFADWPEAMCAGFFSSWRFFQQPMEVRTRKTSFTRMEKTKEFLANSKKCLSYWILTNFT